jgi:hypothetical protein
MSHSTAGMDAIALLLQGKDADVAESIALKRHSVILLS